MKRKVKVKTSVTVNTFAYLLSASKRALDEAKQNEKGRFYKCLTSQLFSAFCLEAYLNHLGKEKIKDWEKTERKLKPQEKLETISSIINLKIEYGKRPFQTFREIFKLRNILVHGKTETNSDLNEQILEESEDPIILQDDWRNDIEITKAIRFSKDTQEMLEILNSKAGFDSSVLFLLGTNDDWVFPSEIK